MAEGKGHLVGAGYPKRSGIYFNVILYVSVFSGLIFALKYAGSLELGTVSSIERDTTTSQVISSSGNKPPEAVYMKKLIQDLKFKMSSFQVCSLEPICGTDAKPTSSTQVASHDVDSYAVHGGEGCQSSMYFQ